MEIELVFPDNMVCYYPAKTIRKDRMENVTILIPSGRMIAPSYKREVCAEINKDRFALKIYAPINSRSRYVAIYFLPKKKEIERIEIKSLGDLEKVLAFLYRENVPQHVISIVLTRLGLASLKA